MFLYIPYFHSSKFTLLCPHRSLVPSFLGWFEEEIEWMDQAFVLLCSRILVRHTLQVGKFLALSYSCHLFQLAISKRAEENPSRLYELNGSETLGSYLRIQPCSDKAPELLKCSIQWYRVSSESSKNEPISGIYSANLLLTLLL